MKTFKKIIKFIFCENKIIRKMCDITVEDIAKGKIIYTNKGVIRKVREFHKASDGHVLFTICKIGNTSSEEKIWIKESEFSIYLSFKK